MHISQFMEHNFRHFNARETLAAAKGYKKFLAEGGKMFMSLAGAMSTAELGLTLAEMIVKTKYTLSVVQPPTWKRISLTSSRTTNTK